MPASSRELLAGSDVSINQPHSTVPTLLSLIAMKSRGQSKLRDYEERLARCRSDKAIICFSRLTTSQSAADEASNTDEKRAEDRSHGATKRINGDRGGEYKAEQRT